MTSRSFFGSVLLSLYSWLRRKIDEEEDDVIGFVAIFIFVLGLVLIGVHFLDINRACRAAVEQGCPDLVNCKIDLGEIPECAQLLKRSEKK